MFTLLSRSLSEKEIKGASGPKGVMKKQKKRRKQKKQKGDDDDTGKTTGEENRAHDQKRM